MKKTLNSLSSMAALSILSLAGCSSLSPAVPVGAAGGSAQPLVRFAEIRDLAVDSQDNVYLAEVQPGAAPDAPVTLRKMTPAGDVINLGGGGDVNAPIEPESDLKSANLVGLNGMMVRDDVLYMTGINCLRSVDLKSADFKVKTIWGNCLNSQAFQASATGPDSAKPVLFNDQFTVTPDKTVYADVASAAASSRQLLKLANGQAKPEEIKYPYEMLGMAVDSKNRIIMSHPYPDAAGPGYIEKWNRPEPPRRYYNGASQLVSDSKDNVYFLEGTTLSRYADSNHRKDIGKLEVAGLDKSKVRLALNPGETSLYVSVGTGIYRFAVPQ